jgi:hypothetical protein
MMAAAIPSGRPNDFADIFVSLPEKRTSPSPNEPHSETRPNGDRLSLKVEPSYRSPPDGSGDSETVQLWLLCRADFTRNEKRIRVLKFARRMATITVAACCVVSLVAASDAKGATTKKSPVTKKRVTTKKRATTRRLPSTRRVPTTRPGTTKPLSVAEKTKQIFAAYDRVVAYEIAVSNKPEIAPVEAPKVSSGEALDAYLKGAKARLDNDEYLDIDAERFETVSSSIVELGSETAIVRACQRQTGVPRRRSDNALLPDPLPTYVTDLQYTFVRGVTPGTWLVSKFAIYEREQGKSTCAD